MVPDVSGKAEGSTALSRACGVRTGMSQRTHRPSTHRPRASVCVQVTRVRDTHTHRDDTHTRVLGLPTGAPVPAKRADSTSPYYGCPDQPLFPAGGGTVSEHVGQKRVPTAQNVRRVGQGIDAAAAAAAAVDKACWLQTAESTAKTSSRGDPNTLAIPALPRAAPAAHRSNAASVGAPGREGKRVRVLRAGACR